MFLTIAQSNTATALMRLAGIICTGVIGGACFTTGILMSTVKNPITPPL